MASEIEVYGHVSIISTFTNRLVNSNGIIDLRPETAALSTSLSSPFRFAGSLKADANQTIHTVAKQVVANYS